MSTPGKALRRLSQEIGISKDSLHRYLTCHKLNNKMNKIGNYEESVVSFNTTIEPEIEIKEEPMESHEGCPVIERTLSRNSSRQQDQIIHKDDSKKESAIGETAIMESRSEELGPSCSSKLGT